MKEPKVQVGILFEPQIEFVLLNPYRMDGTEVSGKQVVTYDEGKILWNGRRYDELLFEPQHEQTDAFELWTLPSASISIGSARKTSVFWVLSKSSLRMESSPASTSSM